MAQGTLARHTIITVGGNLGALGLFALLTYLGTPLLWAVVVIYVIGYLASYLLQRLWNWRSQKGWGREALAYLGVYIGLALVNYACLWWLKDVGVHPILAQAGLIIVLTPVLHFVLGKLVFARGAAAPADVARARDTVI